MNPPPSQLTPLSLAILLALALRSTWSALPVYAQGPIVTGTEPTENAANVEATSSITVTFDAEIDSITFTSSSTGPDDLTLSGSPTITLAQATAFTVTQPASTTLATGESTTFTLTFAPQSEGTFTDTVTISSNDADEGPTTFVIPGLGDSTPPDISVATRITPTKGINVTNPRPTFDWEDASDSLSGVVSYTLLLTSSPATTA